jgi:hypothetical protein
MKFRQANKILKKYASIAVLVNGKLKTKHCNYNKAISVYTKHFSKGKKKVTSKTIMVFNLPVF